MANIRVLFALIALGLVVSAGCSRHHESSYDFLSKARENYAAGKVKTAVINLKNALQEDPKNGEARYLLARIDNKLGNGTAAEIELKKAAHLGVDKDKIGAELGRALVLQNKYKDVLDKVKPSGNIRNKRWAAAMYTVRGDAYIGLKDENKAKGSFERALARDKDYSDANLGLARIAMFNDDQKEAFRQIDQALAKSPKSVRAWGMKGDLMRMLNRPEQAEKAYRHVLELDKDNVSALLDLALMHIIAGKLDEANTELTSAQKIAPKYYRTQYLQGLFDFRKGQYAAARDALQEMSKSVSGFMPGVLLSAAVSYQLGSYEITHQDLTTFLAKNPDNKYASNLLVATDIQLKQPGDALKSIKRLLSKDPGDPGLLALAGAAYMQSKNYEKANEYLDKASRLAPKDAGVRAQLGMSHMISGDSDRAIKDLEQAVALDPNQLKADALLVVARLRKGQFDKALAATKAWEKRQPDNPVPYNLAGGVYLKKHDISSARKNFEAALEKRPEFFPAVLNLVQLDTAAGKPEAARARLKGVLKKDKKNVQAMVALADVAMKEGDNGEAEKWLHRAIKVHPEAVRLRKALVVYFVSRKQFTRAMSAAKEAQAANPNDPDATDLLGSTQLAMDDKKAAVKTFEHLVQMVPSAPRAWMKLAAAQTAAKDLSGARKSLGRALKIDPAYINAEIRMIEMDLGQGKYSDALSVAQRIEKQYPKKAIGSALAGDIESARHHYAMAAKHYRQAFEKDSNSLFLMKLHQALVHAGDAGEADKEVLAWLKKNPDDTKVRAYLGDYYFQGGRKIDAIRQYKRALKTDPDNIGVLNNLAMLYQEGKDPGAVKYAEKAHKLSPKDPMIADTLGWILVGNGDVKRAAQLLGDAADAAPGNPQVGYHYAVALDKAGRRSKARSELRRVLGLGKKFPEEIQARALLDRLMK